MKKLLIILCTLMSIATMSDASVFVQLNTHDFNALLDDYLAVEPYLVIVKKTLGSGPGRSHMYWLHKDGFYFKGFVQGEEISKPKLIVVPTTHITADKQILQ